MRILKFSNARALIRQALTLDYFFGDDPAIPYVLAEGSVACPLIVIVGDNASGKSFFRRVISSICRQNKIECIGISMEGRRQIAFNIGLTFVYGDESYEATGINSINTVLGGIKTCQSRDTDHVIVWDEPDIGLSEGNAMAVGQRISQFVHDAEDHTKAIVVITHSKPLAKELAGHKLHYVHVGASSAPKTFHEWLASPVTVGCLEEIKTRSRQRFLAIQKILDQIKK